MGKLKFIHEQVNSFLSGSSISETLRTNWASATKQSLDSDILDKNFQCKNFQRISATALYLSEISKKGEITTLKYYLCKKCCYEDELRLNELSVNKLSEVHDSKFELSVNTEELRKKCTSLKRLPDFDLIDKDFQFSLNPFSSSVNFL